MNNLRILLILVLLLIVVSALQAVFVKKESISISPTPTPSEKKKMSPSATPTPEVQTFFNSSPTSTPTPTPSSLPNQSSGNYQYPGSTSVGGNTYKSTVDPDVITEWYRQKFADEGMGATSVIKTKANEKVINKIVAADNSKQVSVEITRDPGQAETMIVVLVTSS